MMIQDLGWAWIHRKPWEKKITTPTWVCVCVCVCVIMTVPERRWEIEYERVCVCVVWAIGLCPHFLYSLPFPVCAVAFNETAAVLISCSHSSQRTSHRHKHKSTQSSPVTSVGKRPLLRLLCNDDYNSLASIVHWSLVSAYVYILASVVLFRVF